MLKFRVLVDLLTCAGLKSARLVNNHRSDEVACDCVHAFVELGIFLSDVPDRNDLGKKVIF